VRAGVRRNRCQNETKQIVKKIVGKTDQFMKKTSFGNFRKNKSTTQARKEGKEVVGSLKISNQWLHDKIILSDRV